jgi:hypothetical protein
MHALCRWLVGLLFVAGCDHGPWGNWVEVDLAGTDETWNMYPDWCSVIDANTVEIGEDGHDGAWMTLSADPLVGARVGLVIPEPVEGEPLTLWLGEFDACRRFEVEVTPGEVGAAVRVDLECELPWVGLWTSVAFTDC